MMLYPRCISKIILFSFICFAYPSPNRSVAMNDHPCRRAPLQPPGVSEHMRSPRANKLWENEEQVFRLREQGNSDISGFSGARVLRMESGSSRINSGHFSDSTTCPESVSRNCHRIAILRLTEERFLKSGEPRFDIAFNTPALDDVFAIPTQKIVYRLDTNTDGAGGLVLVEILERKVRCT
jgi:hypothetical protein